MNKCAELKEWEEKKNHYENLYTLSNEELKEKGYSNGKEDIKVVMEKLKAGIERIKKECETGANSASSAGGGASTGIPPVSGGGGGIAVPEQVTAVKPADIAITKPVVAESGKEITDYYKIRISKVMAKKVNTEEKIKDLKELRNEIDKLIEALIKGKDEIKAGEIGELVTEIQVRPNEIKADNVVVTTTGKKIMTRLNKKDIEIKPTKTHIVVKDGSFEVKAKELTIKNKTLEVGNSKLSVAPSDIIGKMNIEPKEIELTEENARAVYKIKTDKNRKLFGFIPLKVEKTSTVDANDIGAGIIKEELPWWDFLTTE